MTWTEALQVGTVVVGALGGGGAIVFAFSGFLGKIWLDRLKGEIDARLRRLDAVLEHGNFLLRRFAEFELEAITECWRTARACVPLLNAIRPLDSGTDEGVLTDNARRLGDAHNALVEALGRHEPFLPADMAERLETIRRVVALELSHVRHHERFTSRWWDQGAINQRELQTLMHALLLRVQERVAHLRTTAESARS